MDVKELTEELQSVLQDLIQEVLRIAGEVRFTKEDPQQLYLVCLVGTLLEYSHTILILSRDSNTAIGLPVLMRTLMEAHVDLVLLARNALHWKNMMVSFLLQRQRALRAAPGNPYLGSVAKSADYSEKLNEVESTLRDLRADGHEQMAIRQKFEDAGFENEYPSLYWSFCQETHNNVGALETRHIELGAGAFEVAYFQKYGLDRQARLLHLTFSLLLGGSKEAFVILDAEQIESRLEDLETTFSRLSNEGIELVIPAE